MALPDRAAPKEIEALISDWIATRFEFACLEVPEVTERLRLEHGLIALLALHPIGPPSPNWTGRRASSPDISASGLWNTQHVRGFPLTDKELERLTFLATLS
jgi:hypothetical protein